MVGGDGVGGNHVARFCDMLCEVLRHVATSGSLIRHNSLQTKGLSLLSDFRMNMNN